MTPQQQPPSPAQPSAPTPTPSSPPPLPRPAPPPVVSYVRPGAAAEEFPPTPAQQVFDTVVGPNIRLRDNLIQLVCVAVGAGLGAAVAGWFANPADRRPLMIAGAVTGVLVALLLSGAVIGVVRLILTLKRR